MNLDTVKLAAAALASFVSTSLEIQRRVSDYRRAARASRLRALAEELVTFLQIQPQLERGGIDEQLTQQAISSTKKQLDKTLQELVRVQQATGTPKVDELSAIRRWLLLFVPARPLGWVLHFGFYFTVCFSGFLILETKEVSASKLFPGGEVAYLIQVLVYIMIAAFLRYWSLMEQRWAEGFQPNPRPTYRRLLWYRPASRRELMARAALVFSLFQFVSFIQTNWISLFREMLTFVEFSVTLIAFYGWNIAELNLATHPVDMKFPLSLRVLRWPQNRATWFWTICFYVMLGGAIFFIKQVATVTVLPAAYRKAEFLQVGAAIGMAVGFLLSFLLPMYALNRISLAQFQRQGTLTTV